MPRRSVLKLAASTAAVFGLGSVSKSVSAASSPSNVVDLGNQGLSPGDDISGYLDEYCVGGNEVHIPEGTYAWDGSSGLSGSFDQPMWVVGDGNGATLDVGDGGQVDLTLTADAAGAHVRLENVTQTGVCGQDGSLSVRAGDPDALIEFVQFDRPDGCEDGVDMVGTYVDDAHAGVARFVNCYYEGFSNNGIYASSPGQPSDKGGEGGRVEILGGLYKNNDVCGLRIGSDDSRIESVAVVQDAHSAGISGGNCQRGIYLREGGENMVIRDCDVTMADFDGACGAVVAADDAFSGGSVSIENTRVRNDISAPVVDTQSSSWDSSGNGIDITGSGSYELEGAGPYDDVCTGSDCESPTTQRRWYGSDGGDGGGGGSDPTLAVSTESATNVGETSATLEGSLSDLGGADSADAGFEYREVGASDWTATATRTLSSTGGFAESLDGLASGTEYEFRAVADASDGDADAGSTAGFTTTFDHHLVVRTFDGSGISYRLDTSGSIVKGATAEGNDSITQNSDGTYTADGFVANAYEDDYYYDGDALDWSATKDPDSESGDYELVLDGQQVTPEEFAGDASLAVSTGSATDVGETSATMEGSLGDLGGADSAEVGFEYREAGASDWTATATQTLSSTGGFAESVDGLSTNTDHEFRAVADASDGDAVAGDAAGFTTAFDHHLVVRTFDGSGISYQFTAGGELVMGDTAEASNDSITDNGDGTYTADGFVANAYEDDYYFDGDALDWSATKDPDSESGDYELVLDGQQVTPAELGGEDEAAPTLDRFQVQEEGSPNPHADITVDWVVSDADGDLSTVLVEVLDASGSVADASRTDVSGGDAADLDYFQIKKADGRTFTVRITVVDGASNTTTATKSVTE